MKQVFTKKFTKWCDETYVVLLKLDEIRSNEGFIEEDVITFHLPSGSEVTWKGPRFVRETEGIAQSVLDNHASDNLRLP